MGPKTKSGIHWTNLELKGLVEDEDSCVYHVRAKKHVGLHPIHLHDINGSLCDMLKEKLNFYDPELNGFILAYRNPKILSPYGEILYDACYIHIDIEADFYVFKPEIGRSLRGFVNKKSTNHIGLLVHKAFNISIPRPDGDELNEQDWPGHCVRVGQEIRFTLEEIDFKSRLPYMRGSLKEEDYLKGCQLFNEQIAANYESEFQEQTLRNISLESSKKTIVNSDNKRIVFNDNFEAEDHLESGPERKSKRKSTPARELEKDNEFGSSKLNPKKKRKRSFCDEIQDTDDEKNYKSTLKRLIESNNMVTEEPLKKRKKKHNQSGVSKDTEDDKKHIVFNSSFKVEDHLESDDGYINEKNDLLNIVKKEKQEIKKKLKKKKKHMA